MSRKLRQFIIIVISLVLTIVFSLLWLKLNKQNLLPNLIADKDLRNMIFNRGLSIIVIMTFVYFIGSLITFITGIKLKIFGA